MNPREEPARNRLFQGGPLHGREIYLYGFQRSIPSEGRRLYDGTTRIYGRYVRYDETFQWEPL